MAHRHHSLTLIPFGLRTADQQLVDVSQVPNGADCGCTCPSCGTPLIARQGTIKEWHFAHASRGLGPSTIQQCEYSFYLSVALMAKQLFRDCRTLSLPDYIYHTSLRGPWSRKTYEATVTLTRGRRVEPDHCETDKQLAGHAVDILCEIAGVPLAIILERPDKPCHLWSAQFSGHKAGVLKIDLLETLRIFRNLHRGRREQGFHQALAHFLFDRRDHKQWIYHPRQETAVPAVTEELQARMDREEAVYRERAEADRAARREAQRRWEEAGRKRAIRQAAQAPAPIPEPVARSVPTPDPKPVPFREPLPRPEPMPPRPSKPRPPADPVRYECVLCNFVWTGDRKGLNPCPKCNSHLYRREVKE